MITNTVFPPPRVFKELYSLVKRDFTKYYQPGYSETPQITGTGLEREVVKLLEDYAHGYDFRVHLTDRNQKRGFAGLLHKFDAGIEEKSDLSQCLFEVKYRGVDGVLNHEAIMKFHHATFEYFLKLLTQQKWNEANIFRCFVTNQAVNNDYRQFFYTWGIALVDPMLAPLPCIPTFFEQFQQKYGATDHLLDLIEQSNRLIGLAYFSLADLVPPEQKFGNTLDLGRLNPVITSGNILAEHKYLQEQIEVLQRSYGRGKYQ